MNAWSAYVSSLTAEPGGGIRSDETLLCDGQQYARVVFDCEQRGDRGPAHRCCTSCGAEHLRCHIGFCYVESCPRCRGQLITCGCFPSRMPPWTQAISIH